MYIFTWLSLSLLHVSIHISHDYLALHTYLHLQLQDNSGGLQVRSVVDGEWMAAPPVPGSFVINIGTLFLNAYMSDSYILLSTTLISNQHLTLTHCDSVHSHCIYRRHAREDDWWYVHIHSTQSTQPSEQRQSILPVLLRPQLRCAYVVQVSILTNSLSSVQCWHHIWRSTMLQMRYTFILSYFSYQRIIPHCISHYL